MPGYLLPTTATVLCSHGGMATAMAPNPSLMVAGAPTVLLSAQWVIAGCPLVPPPLPPCVTAQYVTGTTRVTSNGQPLVVSTGAAISIPNGTPLIPADPAGRVSAM